MTDIYSSSGLADGDQRRYLLGKIISIGKYVYYDGDKQ